MKISYGITVHNEADEIKKLLGILLSTVSDDDDEIELRSNNSFLHDNVD